MNKKHTIPAVDKAISILEYLGSRERGATQSELAKELEITSSTCYRILQTLQTRGWIRQGTGNSYDISDGVLSASMKLINNVARFEVLQPSLERLASELGFSCKLSIRQGHSQLTVLRADSPTPMTVSGKIGARFPVVEGATGAALLSDEPWEHIVGLAKSCEDDIEEKSSPHLIQERLASLEKNGYCMNNRPNRWRVEVVSSPLKNSAGKTIAAISVLGFADDFDAKRIQHVSTLLKTTLTECSTLLK